MALSTSLFVLAALLPGQAPATDYAHNFRGGNMPSPDRMVLNGVDQLVEATPEEGGLRIKILPNRGKDGAGVQTKFALTGDFEITAAYEILSADKPTTGYGVGVFLTISPANWRAKRAGLARCWTTQNGSGFQPLIIMTEPRQLNRGDWVDTETMKGQLRFRREGAQLYYLVNDEVGKPFREIFHYEYGTDNVDSVRLVANPGTSSAALDVRLLDIQMHWGGLPTHARTDPATAPVAADPATAGTAPETGSEPPSRGWVNTVLVLGLGLTILLVAALGLFLFMRQRQGSPMPESKAAAETLTPAAAPVIASTCSGCGKTLKVKAELAGKKVKCPQCGMAVSVPTATETGSGQVSS